MNTNTIAARCGRIAGHAYNVASMIDWAEVARIVGHGLIAMTVLAYMAGYGLGQLVHSTNDRLSSVWVRLWVKPEAPCVTTPEPEPTPEPVAPMIQPLYELEGLTVTKLRAITGIRSKRVRKMELIAHLAA